MLLNVGEFNISVCPDTFFRCGIKLLKLQLTKAGLSTKKTPAKLILTNNKWAEGKQILNYDTSKRL